jgi:hypothetical protein
MWKTTAVARRSAKGASGRCVATFLRRRRRLAAAHDEEAARDNDQDTTDNRENLDVF